MRFNSTRKLHSDAAILLAAAITTTVCPLPVLAYSSCGSCNHKAAPNHTMTCCVNSAGQGQWLAECNTDYPNRSNACGMAKDCQECDG